MAFPWKLLFKSAGANVLTQAADALINPDQAGYGSDVVRALDETVGDAGYLRKLHVVFARTPSTGGAEDVAVCTFHLGKIVSEEASTGWVTGDFTAAEANFDTWWTALKPSFSGRYKLQEYRWYKSGPAWPIAGPAVRITTKNVVGTGTGNDLPPQVACSITERTRIRKSWGRFYLPAMVVGTSDASGRLASSMFGGAGGLLSNTVTLYSSLKAGGTPVYVYSAPKPIRQTKKGITLPAQPGRALGVEFLEMDDVYDVIRSRRYEHGATKTITAV